MSIKPVRLWPDSRTIMDRSRGLLFANWEELLRLRRVVMKTSDLNDIHDLRVASRRFRAVLELFYPFAPNSQKRYLKKSVRKLTRILGRLRNIDEAQLFFQSRSMFELSDDGKLFHLLAELRAKELKRIEKALKDFDHRHLDLVVREAVAGVNEDSITERNSFSIMAYFSEASIRLFMPIQQLLAGSTTPERRSARHALRITIKKYRYFQEIIAPILDRENATLLEQLKEYQSILGRMNDIAEFEILRGNLELSTDERECAEVSLREEDERLLEGFKEMIERKPLAYTFII